MPSIDTFVPETRTSEEPVTVPETEIGLRTDMKLTTSPCVNLSSADFGSEL